MRSRKLFAAAVWIGCAAVTWQAAKAIDPPSPHGLRSGGAIERSYTYHRNLPYTPLASVPRYEYGFPVQTYKWGWFGAQHYYPRTTSHRGYNGDYWQWAYRRGW